MKSATSAYLKIKYYIQNTYLFLYSVLLLFQDNSLQFYALFVWALRSLGLQKSIQPLKWHQFFGGIL